jgi:hypothetical protein
MVVNRDVGTVYVVAESDPAKATEIIRNNVGGPHVELEDLGRVNASLLKALSLQSESVHSHVTAQAPPAAPRSRSRKSQLERAR